MSENDPAQVRPATLTAPDGTTIALETRGDGEPIVLVHGTTSDRSTFNELVPHLAEARAVTTFDRRGRGLSEDGEGYAIDSEFADAAAVIDRIASEHGGPVDVFGHSFGAWIALGATQHTDNVRRLVVYSPGFGARYPEGALDRIEAATDRDDLDTALHVLLTDVIGMKVEDVEFMRASPVWQNRIDNAGTIARECRADESFLETHGDLLGNVGVPVRVVSGAVNAEEKREHAAEIARRLPDAELVEMEGEGHAAHHTAPAALAALILGHIDAGRTAAASA